MFVVSHGSSNASSFNKTSKSSTLSDFSFDFWQAPLLVGTDISRASSATIKTLTSPGVIAVSMPAVVGFGLGAEALGGMLAGGLLGCVSLALMMANAGGAWDNAKKYVEKGNLGGKGSDTHAATVVGDTVGDPFKDTSGPSMNILINVMAIVSLVIAPLLSI